MAKLSRMESNKEVRRVLNRHGVNLTYCQFSVGGMDIRLSGSLKKNDDSDYNGMQIDAMIQDFMKVLPGFSISADFDNWNFTNNQIICLNGTEENGEDQEEGSESGFDPFQEA